MAQLFTNNAESTLASSITNVATSLTVASGEGARFPSPTGGDYFLLTVFNVVSGNEQGWEIVKCTARSGDTLTIVRGQDGTTGAAFSAGAYCSLRVTGEPLTAYEQLRNQKLTLATAQATTSGTSIDFTGIPSWAKRITVMVEGMSTNGSDTPGFRLGTSGGIVSSGYLGSGSIISNPTITTVYTTGMFYPASSAVNIVSGKATFNLLNQSTNKWVGEINLAFSSGPYHAIAATSITLPSSLTTIRLTTGNGTDTFDAGSVNIMYE